MKTNIKILLIVAFLTILSLTFSEIAPKIIAEKINAPIDFSEVELKLEKKLIESQATALNLIKFSETRSPYQLFKSYNDSLKTILDKNKISVYLFKSNELVFWTDNIDISELKPDSSKINLYKIQNKWYLGQWVIHNATSVLSLLFLKSDFPYQNKFLVNRYNNDFKVLTGYNIAENHTNDSICIGNNTRTCFYLSKAKQQSKIITPLIKSTLQWSGFIGLLLIFYILLSLPFIKKQPLLRILLLIISLIGLRLLSLNTGFPNRGFGMLFSPEIYAYTNLNPSLGDFLVNAMLVFTLTIFIYKNIPTITKKYLVVAAAVLSLFVWGFFFTADNLFASLVTHSTLNLETFRIFNLTIYSVFGYIATSFWIASAIIFCDFWLRLFSNSISLQKQALILGSALIVSVGLSVLYGAHPTTAGIIFSILTIVLLSYKRIRKSGYTSNWLLALAIILSIYSIYLVTDLSFKKDIEVRKVLAINLSNERDPVAETLFPGIEKQIRIDTSINKFLGNIQQHDIEMYRYLQSRYFNSYFKRYDLQATVCFKESEIVVNNLNERVDCKSFYDDIVLDYGIQIPNTSFYYLNDQTGQINYLGIIELIYKLKPVTLYIELESKLNREVLGYPELLLESRFSNKELISSYSTAKYQNNMLIAQSGVFPYRLQNIFAIDSASVFKSLNQGGYNHLIYKSDKNNMVILSKPRENLLNTTVSFTYIFSFFFVALLIWLKAAGFPIEIRSKQHSFRNRIKMAMVLVIILSLILVASITIYYSINNFENRSRENLSEKILSVVVEVDRNLKEDVVQAKTYSGYISNNLIQLSNTFYTDINIYSSSGDLIATSRPEIFERGLSGKRMNSLAWYEMNYLHNPKLIHKERIGGLTYLSAYVPIIDNSNNIVAYINLPHFTRQNELMRDLYSIIVAIINIYAFLTLLTIGIAILISNQISKPLELIMANLSTVNLIKHNEPIRYDGNDELGQLVKEYNRMVIELAESAAKLAQSQRETAWREMAKQIAHEIKNPLTPIKLNLQHLIKAKREGVSDWDERFERFSSTLVEQINVLSSIANEFSDFAKMPASNVSELNLGTVLEEVVSLFSGYNNVKVNLNNLPEKIQVSADKEQLLRVFVNLVKNAIQSIDIRKKGEINIGMKLVGGKCLVTIKDNGKGIPEELRSKMFSPNFTTKSGGMGMGLAIVKGIIESINGKVWFETETNIGTTFYVEIPV